MSVEGASLEMENDPATFDARDNSLRFVPDKPYDTCFVEATATEIDGSVRVQLQRPEGDEEQSCGLSATHALVTITGLTEAPTDLTVTEDGETRTVPVKERICYGGC